MSLSPQGICSLLFAMESAPLPAQSLAATYDSDGEDSDSESHTESPVRLAGTKKESIESPRLESALEASLRAGPDDDSNAQICSDYYDADEDDTAPDIFTRQVLARKFQASEAVSKLVCDEVDEHVLADPSVAEIAPDSVSRALSRGKSMGGIRQGGRTGMARSKSQFGSRARSSRPARVVDGCSEEFTNAADAAGLTRGFSRRRNDSGTDHDRRKRVDLLNARTDDEDSLDNEDNLQRPMSIRFA